MTEGEKLSSVFHLNIHGLSDKLLMLEDFISDFKNIEVLCLTEHFSKCDDMSKLKISNFNFASVFCRKQFACGGSAILIRNDVEYIARNDFLDLSMEKCFECTAVDMVLCNTNCTIVCIYRSPNSDLEVFFSKVEYIVSKIVGEKRVPILCGDTNIDLNDNTRNVKLFKELLLSCNLEALISDPTRVCATRSSLIDNIITSSFFVENVIHGEVVNCSFSDHDAQIRVGLGCKGLVRDYRGRGLIPERGVWGALPPS
jgi:hypothetical protein